MRDFCKSLPHVDWHPLTLDLIANFSLRPAGVGVYAAMLSVLQNMHALVEGAARQNVRQYFECADAIL